MVGPGIWAISRAWSQPCRQIESCVFRRVVRGRAAMRTMMNCRRTFDVALRHRIRHRLREPGILRLLPARALKSRLRYHAAAVCCTIRKMVMNDVQTRPYRANRISLYAGSADLRPPRTASAIFAAANPTTALPCPIRPARRCASCRTGARAEMISSNRE